MECNKDEAIRAKDISVRRFTEKDFAGAKKFALKAQALYPALEGISQMLTTIDVYISSENKVNGEMDMYGMLGVNPLADDETIKRHYRKLALLLHPDKNKSVGADGAFQLAKEAYNFLSDKAKRSGYNSRRNIRPVQHQQKAAPPKPGVSTSTTGFRQFSPKVPTQSRGASATTPTSVRDEIGLKIPNFKIPQKWNKNSAGTPVVNGHRNHSNNNSSSSGKSQKTSTQKSSSSSTQGVFKSENTFWTVCTRCKMQYEYFLIYRNQNLKCQHCQEAFIAIEVPPPSNLSANGHQQRNQKSTSSSGPNMFNVFGYSSGGTGARWSPFFGTTAYGSASAFNSSQATSASQLVNERVKRKHEEVQAPSRWEWNDSSGSVLRWDGPSKKRREDETIPSQAGTRNWETGRGFAPGKSQEGVGIGSANVFTGFSSKYNANRELSAGEMRKILTDKALFEIKKRLKELNSAEEKAKVKGRQKSKLGKKVIIQEVEKSHQLSSDTQKGDSDTQRGDSQRGDSDTQRGDSEQEAVEMVEMTVPDPDFHVFDLDRSESCFGENQIWATYDNDDGMPRFYAIIHEVISSVPFKVKISWLNSKSNSEFSSLGWVDRGFTKTCGEFRVGKHETNTSLNSFSQKVKWVKGPRGVVHIYPQKDEIWALYKNWSPDWNDETPDEIRHVYEMVQVLEDYDNDRGVSVSPLVKAPGFRTIFRKQLNPEKVKHIPKEEMFRFSHQVPSYVLTGQEKPNAPKGYVELDPAATPLNLLQVMETGTHKAHRLV